MFQKLRNRENAEVVHAIMIDKKVDAQNAKEVVYAHMVKKKVFAKTAEEVV